MKKRIYQNAPRSEDSDGAQVPETREPRKGARRLALERGALAAHRHSRKQIDPALLRFIREQIPDLDGLIAGIMAQNPGKRPEAPHAKSPAVTEDPELRVDKAKMQAIVSRYIEIKRDETLLH